MHLLQVEVLPCPAGHDIKDDINPIEAGLLWTIGKRRREKWDFVGGDVLQKLHADKSHTHRRIGFFGQKGAPAREGAEIQTPDGKKVRAAGCLFRHSWSCCAPPTQIQTPDGRQVRGTRVPQEFQLPSLGSVGAAIACKSQAPAWDGTPADL